MYRRERAAYRPRPWIPENFEEMCGGGPENRALSEGKLADEARSPATGYTRTAKDISARGGSPFRGEYASASDKQLLVDGGFILWLGLNFIRNTICLVVGS